MIFYDFEVFRYDWLVVLIDLNARKETVIINDPDKLLKWLGKDRAMLEFASADELEGKKPALIAVLRQWIRSV